MEAKEIGKKLKYLRLKKGLRQSELAKSLNVSDKLISKWETGISVPSTEFTLEICKFFEIDVNEFLGLSTPSKSAKKTLSPKLKLTLYFTGAILAIYMLFSLIYFVIVPFSFKNVWLSDIDRHIQNVMDRGYYSLEISTTIDGKKQVRKENAKIEEGILYYEHLSSQDSPYSVIVDKVEYNGLKSYKPFDRKITNLSEILLYGIEENSSVFSSDIKPNYILKTANGYKMSVRSGNFLFDGASVNGKIIADVIFNGEFIKEFNAYFTISHDGKNYNCQGSIIFDLNASPKDIKLYEASYIGWDINTTLSLKECTKEQLGGNINKKEILEEGKIVSSGNDLVFYDNSQICIYNGKTLEIKNQFDIDNKIFKENLKNVFATENYLYVTCYMYDSDVLQINLSDGTYQTLSYLNNGDLIADTSRNLYVLPNGNIYYHVWHFGKNVDYLHKTRNNSTGEYLIGEFIYFDGTYIYTKQVDEWNRNLTIRKYDVNDELICIYTNVSYDCDKKLIEFDGERYYFVDFSVDINFANPVYYLTINNYWPKIFFMHGDRIFSDLGIFYTEKYKAPIVINDIESCIKLNDYIIYKDAEGIYYSIEK